MYKLIILMGKAGSGKDSLIREVTKQLPELHEVISYTTRPKREKEIDGVNYHFITPEDFGQKVVNNEMIECTSFNDWFYGTGYKSLDKTKINIGAFNPDGVDALSYHSDIQLIIFYITATDKNRLIRQLNRENDPDIDEIVRRYKADKIDFDGIEHEFPNVHILINNTKEDFYNCVNEIIKSTQDKFDKRA